MIDQPLINNVPEGEPEGLEVYELKQRIADLEKGLELAIPVLTLHINSIGMVHLMPGTFATT